MAIDTSRYFYHKLLLCLNDQVARVKSDWYVRVVNTDAIMPVLKVSFENDDINMMFALGEDATVDDLCRDVGERCNKKDEVEKMRLFIDGVEVRDRRTSLKEIGGGKDLVKVRLVRDSNFGEATKEEGSCVRSELQRRYCYYS